MLTLNTRVPPQAQVDGELALPYELREKSRLRATLTGGALAGQEAALFLERGTVLRGGDCLQGPDEQGAKRSVRVLAAPEPVLEVECHDADEFARCAYHLGNRHTPLQFVPRKDDGHYALRIRRDHVLAEMLDGLGAHSHEVMAPFEPEAGAYAAAGHAHAASQGHGHGHDDGHDHGHGHAHDHAVHPGSRMPVHEPKIHRPDPAKWPVKSSRTQDK